MVLWRKRVKYPHLVLGAGCLFVLLALLLVLPVQSANHTCSFISAEAWNAEQAVYPSLARQDAITSSLGANFDLQPSLFGMIPVTGSGRYEAFTGQGVPPDSQRTRRGVFLRDHQAGREHWIGPGESPVNTPDGRYLVFLSKDDRLAPGDNNRGWDVVLYDRVQMAYELISVNTDGQQTSGMGIFSAPSVSADGRYVVFSSDRSGLVPDADSGEVMHIYLRDRLTNTTTMLSKAADGQPANGDSWQPEISASGKTILFNSNATNLVKGSHSTASGVVVCSLSPEIIPANGWKPSWAKLE
jgi:hypothetical protein